MATAGHGYVDLSEDDSTVTTSNVQRPKRRFMEHIISTHSLCGGGDETFSSPCPSSRRTKQRRLSPSVSSSPSTQNSTFSNNTATTADAQSPKMKQIYNILLQINPKEYAKAGFRANGYSVEEVRQTASSKFQDPIATDVMTSQYTTAVVTAFRQCDMAKIRQLHKDGQLTSNASNAYGESVLHIASRRGNLEMLKFLIEDVQIDPRKYCDDYGRTALHDACWTPTSEPAFDVVDYLLTKSPEHLLLKDKRGFTPLDYIRPKDHGKWLRFLWERKTKLRPSTADDDAEKEEDKQQQIVG